MVVNDLKKSKSCLWHAQHALRLSAFGQLHKVLGMDPLPSKMPKKPRSETSIEYTGKLHIYISRSCCCLFAYQHFC